MKRCSTLLAIREKQIKTTVRYLYTLHRMAQKVVTKPYAGEDVERPDPSYDVGRNVKWYQLAKSSAIPFKKKKLNMQLPYDPAIALLGMYPREIKTYVHTKTCT